MNCLPMRRDERPLMGVHKMFARHLIRRKIEKLGFLFLCLEHMPIRVSCGLMHATNGINMVSCRLVMWVKLSRRETCDAGEG